MKNKSSKQAPKKALRKTDVSGRLSSYQKMKQKYEANIRQLTDDIITLVEEKDFMKVTTVKMQWRMRLDTEKMIWFGSPTCHQHPNNSNKAQSPLTGQNNIKPIK